MLMPDVEEAWEVLAAALERHDGCLVRRIINFEAAPIDQKSVMAAGRDAMLAAAREVVAGHFCKGATCEWCEVLSKVCARIRALGEGKE